MLSFYQNKHSKSCIIPAENITPALATLLPQTVPSVIALCIGHKQLQVFVQGLEYVSEGARANSPVHSDEKLLLAVLHLELDVGLLSGISAEVPPEILKPCEVFLRLRSCSRLLWNNVRSCRAAAGAAGAASSDSDSLFA